MVIEGTEAPDEFIPYTTPIALSLDTKNIYKGDKIDILNKQYALKWGRYDFEAGVSSMTIDDMKSNGEFYSTVGGTINGQTITFEAETTQAGYIIYERNEMVYENITDTTLISQLDKLLLSLKEYDDETNIEFDKEVLFEVETEKNNLSIIQDEMIELEKMILEGGE